ncbi:MAG: DNA glycosylase [Propioniciclava sp.]|uniref:DNA-formamidopyrimidine glycosylase family protein n=1 Tax=Propioniciclava sp. TaxID=2038686 RepID=UPI0039E28C1C
MPEGDAVWRAARRLHQAFTGQVLIRTDFRWPSLATTTLVGARTLEVIPRGKHMLHRVEVSGRGTLDGAWTIHSHFRMDGTWRHSATTHPPGAFRTPTVRAVLATAERTAVGDTLGMLDVVRTADEHLLVGHLGPDVLGRDWDAARAAAHLATASGTIGAALLDQRNLAGLGTIWTAESLFAQRISPWRPASDLTADELVALAVRAQKLIAGSLRYPLSTSTGDTRRGRETYVYRRLRQPCRRCGTPVSAGMVGTPPQDRNLFYCPTCQAH